MDCLSQRKKKKNDDDDLRWDFDSLICRWARLGVTRFGKIRMEGTEIQSIKFHMFILCSMINSSSSFWPTFYVWNSPWSVNKMISPSVLENPWIVNLFHQHAIIYVTPFPKILIRFLSQLRNSMQFRYSNLRDCFERSNRVENVPDLNPADWRERVDLQTKMTND